MSRPGTGPYVDLVGLPDLSGVTWQPDGSARIGALTTIAELARDERLHAAYPALTLTAGALATPQIRAVATIGGNLLQRNRCWYFRNPAFSCHQNGGDSCPARAGLNLYSAVIDTSPCLAPHPSSMAMALLAYDAEVEVHGRPAFPVGELYGSDPTRDHLLDPGEILLAVHLPPPAAGERAAYYRATSRSEAEWPLVEAVARVTPDGATAVSVGGVARVPLRLPEVEQALAAGESMEVAAGRAATRCAPTAANGYKVTLLTATVLEVLEQATAPS
ncbi:FAD binding domain-containing protein [Nonomuraea sp. MCN248]|uniref:FAD binding domain-containing protein n=2 Tax=Nonomuraea corallina TaxID=2989783 RepID=A0ABT4SEV7_9ACTN|nr:FAD binding domain-containing protein [Nonomuraea corallina]MDA0635471.1 FAD binding domain-containing protein [Nonomuraea corallina]